MRDFKYSTDFIGFETLKGRIVSELRAPSDKVSDTAIDRFWLAHQTETGCPVRVKFILEPLKVRTISCGSYEAYSCQKPLQKVLWNRMQRFSPFILTGTPIDCGIVQKIAAGKWEEGDLLVSGDYSSATDLLFMDATIQAMIACMTGPVLKVALSALGPQLLQYYGPNWICKLGLEERVDELPKPVWQRNGQLMGSPLSFPFLCVINAAVFRLAYESWNDCTVKIKDLPVLVNGDDIGFRSSWDFYQWWRWNIQQVGFQPSVGKNFTSEDFVNINSQYYRIDKIGDIHYVAEQVPYVNMGLITGRQKGDTLDDIGFDSETTDILIALQSSSSVVQELLLGHDKYSEYIYQEWKIWRNEMITNFPVGFHANGLGTEIGPSTLEESKLSFHLGRVPFGRIPMPEWSGSAKNTVMGAFWKPFVQFHDEFSVLNGISRAVYRAKRCKNFGGQWKVAQPQRTKNEILLGGSSWSECSSRVGFDNLEVVC